MQTTEKMHLVGYVTVDSGCVMITDPCYLIDSYNEETYQGMSKIVLKKPFCGQHEVKGNPVVVSLTQYGDGTYPVYTEFEIETRQWVWEDRVDYKIVKMTYDQYLQEGKANQLPPECNPDTIECKNQYWKQFQLANENSFVYDDETYTYAAHRPKFLAIDFGNNLDTQNVHSLTEQIQPSEIEHVGYVSVDSGQVMIVDPGYVVDSYSEKDYQNTCHVTSSESRGGQDLIARAGAGADAVTSLTQYGDGSYSVYTQFIQEINHWVWEEQEDYAIDMHFHQAKTSKGEPTYRPHPDSLEAKQKGWEKFKRFEKDKCEFDDEKFIFIDARPKFLIVDFGGHFHNESNGL